MTTHDEELSQFCGMVSGATAASPLGGRFSNVKPLKRTGGLYVAGTFSVLFSATDSRTSQEVALKFFRNSTDKYRTDCFYREAEVSSHLVGKQNITQLIGELDVLNIPAKTQWGDISIPCPYFALEKAKEGLDEFLVGRRKPKPLFRRLEVLRDAVRGLNRLHAAGYCHRDLKLENILLFSGGIAKLADLGTARRFDGSERLTTDYLFPKGDMRYAAPEMFAGAGFLPELFVGADWFGMGAMLFEAATNQNLWVAIGLRSPLEVKRTIAAAMNVSSYITSVGQAASQYPIPSTEDYSGEAWLRQISPSTHAHLTQLIRAMCNFDFRRRLTHFSKILGRLDVCIALARRDHNRSLGYVR